MPRRNKKDLASHNTPRYGTGALHPPLTAARRRRRAAIRVRCHAEVSPSMACESFIGLKKILHRFFMLYLCLHEILTRLTLASQECSYKLFRQPFSRCANMCNTLLSCTSLSLILSISKCRATLEQHYSNTASPSAAVSSPASCSCVK